jgi:hypothetical protein
MLEFRLIPFRQICRNGKSLELLSKGAPGVAGGVPIPPGSKNVVSWTPKTSVFVRVFLGAREDQPVLPRSRAICRPSRIFSEILQDRHRLPSDLADKLMRNSSSGQNPKKIGIPVPWGDFKGRQPLAWQLNFFSDATPISHSAYSDH